ncbi:MAG: glycosyltransferase family 4 protein [Caldilineaceae bacterium]|nr:glycosyltransferase family 4 protein [Caldilineaceae bacterium]
MDKVGVLVGEHGHWGFFKEIYADFQRQYATQLFVEKTYNLPLLYGRLNRWAYHSQIRSLLAHSDACFFEWASELLVPASFMTKRCPIITRLHSYEVNVWAPQVNWENVDRIIFVSHYIRKKFLEVYGAQEEKTCVINNGVDLQRFAPTVNKPFAFNIGMMGTILPVKRIYEALFTIAELVGRGYRPHLHVAGGKDRSGHYEGYHIAILRAIEKLKLRDYVTMHGHVTDTERWLREMDIYLSNSYWEGQSVALLEAMASGCYALSHFWDGSEDILPAAQLYGRDHELVEKLIAYSQLSATEKEDRRQQMRAIACQHYDIRETSQQIRQIIDETIHGATSAMQPQIENVIQETANNQQVLA